MSAKHEIELLESEITASLAVTDRIQQFYDSYAAGIERTVFPVEQRIVVAEILGNYYTAVETIFLRISQFFENGLRNEKWHADLLYKMTIEIPGTRPRLLSDRCYTSLRELMRFRHFRRYYLEFEYDGDKLTFLEKKFAHVREHLPGEIETFLRELRDART
jgi:hypothetical protein